MEWLLIILVPILLLWLYNYWNDPIQKIKRGNRQWDKFQSGVDKKMEDSGWGKDSNLIIKLPNPDKEEEIPDKEED